MLHQCDLLCDRFEEAWLAGESPAVTAYLREIDPSARGELLRHLLRLELEYRRRRGEQPALANYLQQFPEDAEVVRSIWGDEAANSSDFEISLTVVEGPNQGRAFTFDRHDTFMVGRSPDAGFSLPEDDPYVSRNHFLIEVNPPACRVMDVNSHNGTKVNGAKITVTDLKDGDEIEAGKTRFKVRLRGKGDPYATRTLPPIEEPPGLETVSVERERTPEIAGYRIDEKLGEGGMGAVYRAQRLADGAEVAIKTIKPTIKQPAKEAIARFLRETEIMRSLNHPHIVSFRDAGQAGDWLYFAMDLIPGRDAGKLLKETGPLAIGRGVRLICQVLEALGYAHGRQVVHRDLKPGNVLVATSDIGRGETAKLTDFGLARAWQDSPMSGLTVTGHIAGTPSYMPPEQILNFRTVAAAGDQYSAAVTLYDLLTGKPLFDGKLDVQELFKHILQKDPVALRQRRPEVPEALSRAVDRALSRNPKERFTDVLAFRAALLPFAGD